MLNAIAKMTTDAVGAVADTVESVLPGKGGKDAADPVDADTARDQDTDKTDSKSDKKPLSAGTDQGEGLASHQLDESPEANIARNSDIAGPEPTTEQDTQESAGPEFETTEKETTSQGEEQVKTHKDDVKLTPPPPPPQPQQTAAPTTDSTDPSPDTTKSSADSSMTQPSLTAGSKPLPKMSRGKAKWMKSSSLWYPDRAGVMHAPGVYINRKPRSNYLNPMNKVEVTF